MKPTPATFTLSAEAAGQDDLSSSQMQTKLRQTRSKAKSSAAPREERKPRTQEIPSHHDKPAADVPHQEASVSSKPVDIDTLASTDTLAEAIDWAQAEVQANAIPESRAKAEARNFEICRKELGKMLALEGRGQKALARALASVFERSFALLNEPAVLIAACRQADIKLTKRTLTSPCLAVVKLAFPDLDRKVHSLYARALNYGLARKFDAMQFAHAVETTGVVSLAKEESARQRLRRGEKPKSIETELLERFRDQRRPLELDEIEVPSGADFALIIVGVLDGQFMAYEIDDDRARLMAAVRKADHTGGSIQRVQKKAA